MLKASGSNLQTNSNPTGFPADTWDTAGAAGVEGPGSETSPGASGTVACDIHVFWPADSLTGAPTSVAVQWYTTDQLNYNYYIRGSSPHPSSGNVSGSASVTEGNGSIYPYSEVYNQQAATQSGTGSTNQNGESVNPRTYATSFTLDREDGYYYDDINVDNVGITANDSYTAPTYGDTKDNGFTTRGVVYFTIPS